MTRIGVENIDKILAVRMFGIAIILPI